MNNQTDTCYAQIKFSNKKVTNNLYPDLNGRTVEASSNELTYTTPVFVNSGNKNSHNQPTNLGVRNKGYLPEPSPEQEKKSPANYIQYPMHTATVGCQTDFKNDKKTKFLILAGFIFFVCAATAVNLTSFIGYAISSRVCDTEDGIGKYKEIMYKYLNGKLKDKADILNKNCLNAGATKETHDEYNGFLHLNAVSFVNSVVILQEKGSKAHIDLMVRAGEKNNKKDCGLDKKKPNKDNKYEELTYICKEANVKYVELLGSKQVCSAKIYGSESAAE